MMYASWVATAVTLGVHLGQLVSQRKISRDKLVIMYQERGPRGTSEGIPGLSEGTLAENLRGFQTPQWEPRLRDSEKPSDGETLVESPEKPFRGALQMPLLGKSPPVETRNTGDLQQVTPRREAGYVL